MKRLVVALLLMTLVFSGCGKTQNNNKGSNDPTATPPLAPLVIDESKLNNDYVIEEITENNSKDGLESVIKYPKVSKMADSALEERINKAINDRIVRYKDVANQMGGLTDDTGIGDEAKINQVLNVSYEVGFRSKYTLSIKLILENYFVDLEEPDEIFESINFNLRNGTRYEKITDVIKDENKLTSLLTKKVKESEKKLKQDITGLEAKQGFYIKDNALVLFFQTLPYTTADIGPLEYDIPYDEIKDIVKDPKVWEAEPASTSMNEYNNIINEETRPLEALSFINGKIKNVNQEEATTMILSFEEIQARYLSIYTDKLSEEKVQSQLFKTFEYNFDQNRPGDIKDEKVRALVKEIIDGGYSIICDEGSFIPIQNYQMLEKYTEFVQDEIKDYIIYKATESKRTASMASGNKISWDELAKSISDIEKYFEKYPNSIKESEISKDYQFYFHAYLFGLDDPAFSYETKKIDEELLKSYRNFIAKNEKSETSMVLKQYITIVEKNNKTLCKEIEDFRKTITEDPDIS